MAYYCLSNTSHNSLLSNDKKAFPGKQTFSTETYRHTKRMQHSNVTSLLIQLLIYFCIFSSLWAQIIHIITDCQARCAFAFVFWLYDKAVTLQHSIEHCLTAYILVSYARFALFQQILGIYFDVQPLLVMCFLLLRL